MMGGWIWLTRKGLALHQEHPDHQGRTFCRFEIVGEADTVQKVRWLFCKNCVAADRKWSRRFRNGS